ncbi:hypothetical protein BH23CHL8_BH23CHL8_26260 [soil metagenome]
MRAEWRPLPAWPYAEQAVQPSRFDSTWTATLDLLEREIEAVYGQDPVIGVVADPSQFTIAGSLKGNARVMHRGVEVSFGRAGRRLTFHTATFPRLADNLRAIALGLEALRKVDRYGITTGGEQYAGFQALEAGPVERGRRLVEEAGSVEAALKANHPDHGGHPRAFQDVLVYRAAIEQGGRSA